MKKKLQMLLAFLCLSMGMATAQITQVTGVVVSAEDDQPVIGASVLVKGTTHGSITDLDGRYTIENIPSGKQTLVVSFVGMKTIEVAITNRNMPKISLKSDTQLIDEVVVVGYGIQKKVNMTGAVSSVSMGQIENRPVTNATNALAGLAAGLSVSNAGGTVPGYEAQTIRIRGTGTLNNADPLVVIDGMAGGSISDVNPQDIESISILKDAASSAIYGSRAANGVILITTKKGSEGTARITYSGNVSFETVAKRMNIVTNYANYMEYQNQGLVTNGKAARFSQAKIDEWRNDNGQNPTIYPNTDWQDHIFRDPSVVQSHTVSAIGGTKTVKYNLSFGYVDNPGLVRGTDYQRYQLRSNVEAQIKPWLKVGINAYGYRDQSDPSATVAGQGGDVIWGSGGFNTVPGMTLYDEETGLYGGIQNPEENGNISNYNPYRRMWFYKKEFPTRTNRTVAKFYGQLKPIKGLTIDASFTQNNWERLIEQHITDKNLYRFTKDGPVLLREGTVRTYIRKYNHRREFRTSDITARYEFKIDKLNASIMAGASQEYEKYEYEYFGKYDLTDDSLTGLDAGTVERPTGGYYDEWAMRSFFGRINLNWDEKYMLEFNMRADGSSKFGKDNRWGYFPSVSAGWRITQEKFMEDTQDWLSQLKLRASYGTLGNNATTTNYMYQSVYAAQNYVLGNAVASGLAQTTLSNADLTWETTHMLNIGLDYGFFDNRLSGSIEWFKRRTDGILISLPVPFEHGTSTAPNQNAGEVVNKGFDFDIDWNDRIGNVDYNVGFNMGYVKNEVTEFADAPSIASNMKTEKGKPIKQIYVLQVDRIVRNQADLDYVQSLVDKNPKYFSTYTRPELGDFLFKDANGDGNLDTNDRVEIGNGNAPTITYGFNLGLSWKNFDLSVLMQGVGDYKVYYNNEAFRFTSELSHSLIKDIVENQWTPENPDAKYPKLRNTSDTRNQKASDAFVHDASYLRCKNIQLGYTIPKSLTQKFYVQNLKLYTSIDNLFTISDFPGFDPEVAKGVAYPVARAISFGVNVSF